MCPPDPPRAPRDRTSAGAPLLLKAFGAAILVGVTLWTFMADVHDGDNNDCGRLLASSEQRLSVSDGCDQALGDRQTQVIVAGAIGATLLLAGWWTSTPPSFVKQPAKSPDPDPPETP